MNGRMLTLAREARGLTQSALASVTGISQASVSKIESGIRNASESELSILANALRYPSSLFCLDEKTYRNGALVDFLFRKGMAVRQRALGSIGARLELLAIHLKPLFSAIDIQPALPLPIIPVSGDSHSTPASIAAQVRIQWKIPAGPIPDIMSLIEAAGIVIVPFLFKAEKVDAASVVRPDLPPIIFADLTKPMDRLRFSLAHELGHLIMHARSPIESEQDRDFEVEADAFAGNLMVPGTDLKPHIFPGIGLDDFIGLKLRWRASIRCLVYRSAAEGLIPQDRKITLYKMISARGWTKREPGLLAPERPKLLEEVLHVHRNDLDYSLEDLAAAMHIDLEDLRTDLLGESPRTTPRIVPRLDPAVI